MIPKIIWQTHNYKYDELPDNLFKNLKTWETLNPTWEHKYIDNYERDNFIKNNFPQFYNIFKTIDNPVFQCDFWRYLVVYKYGGVYADMDSICTKPLDYMLQDYNGQDFIRLSDKVTDIWPHSFPGNSHYAAKPNSPILKKIIDDLVENQDKDFEEISFDTYIKHSMTAQATLFFDASFHATELKKRFYNFYVDYYGKNILYSDFLKHHSNLSQDDIKKCSPLDADHIIHT